MKTKRIVAPFTNEYGTFNPGDECIAVTLCTKQVKVARVEYVGYVERDDYNWNTKQTERIKYAQIRRPTSRFIAFYKGTNDKAYWPYDGDVEYRDVPSTTITTLYYNRLLPAQAITDQLMKEI